MREAVKRENRDGSAPWSGTGVSELGLAGYNFSRRVGAKGADVRVGF